MASKLNQTKSKQPPFTESKINAESKKENQILWSRPAGLDTLLGQLDALMASEDYDGDFLSPTESAAMRMRGFLTEASGILHTAFPLGTLSADGDGGLRLEWIRPDRELRLIVSASPQGRSYIYHEQGKDYAADYAPNADKLSKWLDWLGN